MAIVFAPFILSGGGQVVAEEIDYVIDMKDGGGQVSDASAAVVVVDGAYFSSFRAAVDYAEPGQTIMFVADTWIAKDNPKDGKYIVYDVDGLTIDLNAKTVKVDQAAMVFQGVGFTVKNGTMVMGLGGTYPLYIGDEGTTDNVILQDLVLNGGANIYNATGVVLRNVESHGTTYYAVWCGEDSRVTIENGKYDTQNGPTVLAGTSITGRPASLRINGGAFTIPEGKGLLLGGEYMQDLTIAGGVFKGDGMDPDEVNRFVTGGFKLVGSAASGFTAVDGSKVETTEVSGKTSQRVETGGLTLDVDGLVEGTLDVVVLPAEVSEIQGYGTPAAVYDVIVSGTAWTGGGTITVTVPLSIPDGQRVDSGSVMVFYIPDDGEPEDMGAVLNRDGSTISFSTDHNSEYAVFYNTVVSKKFIPLPEDVMDGGAVSIPSNEGEEGDGPDVKIVALVAACAVVFVAVLILVAPRLKP